MTSYVHLFLCNTDASDVESPLSLSMAADLARALIALSESESQRVKTLCGHFPVC